MTWLSREDSSAVLQSGPFDGTSNTVANNLLSPKTKPELISFHQQLAIARVQRASLPAQTPTIPGLGSAIFYKPAHSVGGDYYDFLCLPNGEWGIAVGDVSGKGISAALVMANLQGFLRAQTFQHAPDLPTLMSNLNRLVWQSSPQHFFASLFYGEYDPQSRRFQYVNAGHNAPIGIRRARNNTGTTDYSYMAGEYWAARQVHARRSAPVLFGVAPVEFASLVWASAKPTIPNCDHVCLLVVFGRQSTCSDQNGNSRRLALRIGDVSTRDWRYLGLLHRWSHRVGKF